MPADVELDIRVTKRGDGADKVARDLNQAARAADNLGDELERVDRKLVETRALMAAAGREFVKTGDISPLRSLLRDEKQLNLVRKSLAGIGDEVKRIESAGSGSGRKGAFADIGVIAAEFSQSFGRALPLVSNPYIAGGLAAAIAVGAPAIGAAFGAAVLGGATGGALAAGIAAQFSDPRVKAAASDLVESLADEFRGISAPIADPLLAGIAFLKRDLSAALKDLEAPLAKLAPYASSLADSLGQAGQAIARGLGPALERSAPLLEELGDDLVIIGEGLGEFFDNASAGAEGAGEALRTIAIIIAEFLSAAGETIGVLGQWYEAFIRADAAMVGFMEHWPVIGQIIKASGVGDDIRDVRDSFDKEGLSADEAANRSGKLGGALKKLQEDAVRTASTYENLARAMNQTSETASTLAGAMTDKILGTMLSLDRASLGFAESLTHIGEAFKENGRQLDINSAKGQANRQAVLGAVTANLQQYDALIKAGAGADVAAQAYDANTQSLDRQLRKAGLTAAQVDGLIGKYRNVPDTVDTNIVLQGLTAAINSLDALLRRLNGLDYDRTIFVDVWPRIHGGKGGQLSRDNFFDEGGWVKGSPGEPVPAIVHAGEYVLSRDQIAGRTPLAGLGGSGGGWPGGGRSSGATYSITVNAGMGARGQDVGAAVVSAIKDYERSNGAGWRN